MNDDHLVRELGRISGFVANIVESYAELDDDPRTRGVMDALRSVCREIDDTILKMNVRAEYLGEIRRIPPEKVD